MNTSTFATGTFVRSLIIGVGIGLLSSGAQQMLTGAVNPLTQNENDPPVLAPCSRYEDRYKDKAGFKDKYIQEWPDLYHETVNGVVEEHLEMPALECDAEDYEAFMKAGPKLTEVAKSLPIWQDPKVRLTRYDLGRVLLEYLRVYECALEEYSEGPSEFETAKEIAKEEDEGKRTPDPLGNMKEFFLNIVRKELTEEDTKRLQIIAREKVLAREALNRTLGILSAMDRLRPMEMELQCLQQISLDIRNITALSAEASACMPRSWNAKDILRDVQ